MRLAHSQADVVSGGGIYMSWNSFFSHMRDMHLENRLHEEFVNDSLKEEYQKIGSKFLEIEKITAVEAGKVVKSHGLKTFDCIILGCGIRSVFCYNIKTALKKRAFEKADNLIAWLLLYSEFPQNRKDIEPVIEKIILSRGRGRFSEKELSVLGWTYSAPLAVYIRHKQG